MHPLVRFHPQTHKLALYLGRRRQWPSQYIGECSTEESEQLLDKLWTEATRPALAWTHHWQVGDMLVWDNRCTMHRAMPYDESRFKRDMRRATVMETDPAPVDDQRTVATA